MSLGLRRCVEGNKVEAERSYLEITLLLLLARVVVKILDLLCKFHHEYLAGI